MPALLHLHHSYLPGGPAPGAVFDREALRAALERAAPDTLQVTAKGQAGYVPYPTFLGNQHPAAAYFARGTGHNPQAGYSERPDDWENNLARLAQKHDTARTLVPKPFVDEKAGAKVGIISYGSADPAVVEARDQLREAGIETSYLRLKALPLDETTREFIGKYDHVYVVEINFDAQMRSLLQLHTPEYATRLIATNKCDGLPLTAQFIADKVKQGEGKA